MERVAAIDVGTNSVLLLVAEAGDDGLLVIVEDHAVVTRLGEGLRTTGRIGQAGTDRTAAEIVRFAERAEQLGASPVLAAGTMAMRTASNAAEFVQRIEREAGVQIRIIDGEEEARLTYLGVRSDLPTDAERLVIFDAGGGSTELIVGSGRRLDSRCSLEVGAVTLTDRFLTSDPVTPAELDSLRRYLREEALRALPPVGPDDSLIGVGGTVTTMAAVHHGLERYDRQRVHGTHLSPEQVTDQVATYAQASIAKRAEMAGLEPGRADVILAGAVLVESLLEQTGASSLVVSDRGLRHGLVSERMSG